MSVPGATPYEVISNLFRACHGNAKCVMCDEPSSLQDSRDAFSSILCGISVNKSLREVFFSLSSLNPNRCELLVAELLRNSSLRKITLEPERFDAVQAICQELRDKGHARDLLLPGRRDVAGTLLPPWVRDHTQCPRFVLDHSNMWKENMVYCRRGIYVMPSFETVTSLCVREETETFLNSGTCRLLAEYLARTTELRELNVTTMGGFSPSRRGPVAPVLSRCASDSLSAFVESLVANSGVTRVFLSGLPLEDDACKALARALRSGWRVYELTLVVTAQAFSSFFSAPTEPPGSERLNRSLTNLRVRTLNDRLITWAQENSAFLRHQHLFVYRPPFLDARKPVAIPTVVADVVQRNYSVATLAAHHVTGRTAGAPCADALHQIARADRGGICERNPALVAKVQELAPLDIDHDRACQLIKDSVRCLLTLDGYMRAAGVVRRTVECYPDPKGQRQLPDLGDDAWAFIRRYLNVADVL